MSSAKPFVHQSRIRLVDTDASGFIHYSAIFRHVEAAENEFLRALGQPQPPAWEPGGKYPRARAECDFLRPLRFDDLVDTTVTVERVGGTSFTLQFALACRGEVAARVRLVIVCLDDTTGKGRPLPEPLAAALRAAPAAGGAAP